MILGSTEIGPLINQDQTEVPLYDTTSIHAAKAVGWAFERSLPGPLERGAAARVEQGESGG